MSARRVVAAEPKAHRHGSRPADTTAMAARATWKGFLKISLVNIPIKVFPATESSGTISFNQLHGECQTRIQQKRWCPHCNREVPNSEIVKGYEFEKGRYVVLSEEDFEKVRPESTRVIDLVQFADDSRRSIRCTWIAPTTSRRTAAWRPTPSRSCATA